LAGGPHNNSSFRVPKMQVRQVFKLVYEISLKLNEENDRTGPEN
jgi:hypothetical protein